MRRSLFALLLVAAAPASPGPDPRALRETVAELVGFGTRHTLSTTTDPYRGIGAARRWVSGRFGEIGGACHGCLAVETIGTNVSGPRAPSGVRVIDFGTTLDNPDFAAVANAMGIKGVRIDDPANLEAGLAEAFAHDGPVVVDALVERIELAMPPRIGMEMAKGFTLYMLKAVLNGKGDEIVELAKANLRL